MTSSARVAHEGAGQRQSLALAARQRRAALAQLGVEAARQGRDEAVGLHVRSASHTSLVGDVAAERDVGADAVVEQERALRHDGDRAGQLVVRQVADVGAVRRATAPRVRDRRAASAAR